MAVEVRKADDTLTVLDSELDGVTNGDPETTYTLRTLTTDKVRALRKPYQRERMNPRTHQREELPLTDDDTAAYALDLLDYAIVGWSGILYQGQPLECVRQHKDLLDSSRKSGVLAAAGLNRSTPAGGASKDASFRQPA